MEPKKALSDFYQLASGGSGTGDKETPSLSVIGEYIKQDTTDGQDTQSTPREFLGRTTNSLDFAQPSKNESDIKLDRNFQKDVEKGDAALKKALDARNERDILNL